MPRLPERPLIVTAPTDRALLAAVLAALRAELGEAGEGEPGSTMVPWQVTAAAFEDLPRRLLEEVLAAWAEAGGQLAGIELSGYLQTDGGPRAWGYVAIREATAAAPPAVEEARVTRDEGGYRVEVALRPRDADDA